MKGCLLLFIGMILGALLLIVVQVLIVPPPAPAVAPPQPGDLVILIRNEYLTRLVTASLKQVQTPVPIQNVTLAGQADQTVVMSGVAVVTIQGVGQQRIPVQVTVRPYAENGTLRIQIVGARLGSLRLPPQLASSIEQPLNTAIADAMSGARYRIVGASANAEGVVADVMIESQP